MASIRLVTTKFTVTPISPVAVSGIGTMFSGDPKREVFMLLWNVLAPANPQLTPEKLAALLNAMPAVEIRSVTAKIVELCKQMGGGGDERLLMPGCRDRGPANWEWPKNFELRTA